MANKYLPLADRFAARVWKTGGCWYWNGAVTPNGYGQISHEGKLRMATHVALELVGIEVPKGNLVLHHCDTPACVRVDHLAEIALEKALAAYDAAVSQKEQHGR